MVDDPIDADEPSEPTGGPARDDEGSKTDEGSGLEPDTPSDDTATTAEEGETRNDPAVDPTEIDAPIVLFDGVCNLCTGFVQFLIPRDSDGRFRFASLQSDVGERLLEEHALESDALDSIVLVEGDDVYVKSAAVIRIASILGGIYALARPLRYLPRRLRDWGYDLVAANRYRLFGKKDQCMMPSEDVRSRFLD